MTDEILGLKDFDSSETEKEQSKEYLLRLRKKSPPSVYYCNYRYIYEDNYPAKFDEEFARFLIQLYTNERDLVFDPMAGSGVIPLVANSLNRRFAYQDVNESAVKLFKKKLEKVGIDINIKANLSSYDNHVETQDARQNMNSKLNCVDLILTSPPFGLSISAIYDKYSDNPNDIGNSTNYEGWRQGIKEIIKNCLTVLKPNRLMMIETRPRSKKGHSYPLQAWITNDAIEIGFEYFAEIIEINPPWRMWTFGTEESRMPFPNHSYLTIFQKPENEELNSNNQITSKV